MNEETQRLMLEYAKKALAMLSMQHGGTDFIFEMRDLIRKAESEREEKCTR